MINLKKYNDKDEAINDHKKNYRSQGDSKGKFLDNAPDKYRVEKLTNNVHNGTIVLDIGCNDGGLGRLLQSKGCVVYGVDVVTELVEIANCKGIFAFVGEAENLPWSDNKFDHVVMAEVLEHLYDPEDALKEINRVMKEDGSFLGSVPHNKGNLGVGKKADYHNWIFTYNDLLEMLSKYFKEVYIQETPYSVNFCKENNIDTNMAQWYNWKCIGAKKWK